MSSNSVFAPFVLTVTIHRANNLPIKDFTSSDPFVEVCFRVVQYPVVLMLVDSRRAVQIHIGSVQVEKGGRSPTISRSLNPVWEWTSDPIPLLHLHSPLILKVFDEDAGEKNDFMGIVSLSLLKLTVDTPQVHEMPLRDVTDKKNEQGTIRFTTRLDRSKNVIRISRELPSENTVPKRLTQPTVAYLQALFEHFNTPQALRDEIMRSKLVQIAGVAVNEFRLFDLVSDIYCLQQQMQPMCSFPLLLRPSHSLKDLQSLELLGKVRHSHQLTRSTDINLATGKCSRGPVTPNNSISFIFDAPVPTASAPVSNPHMEKHASLGRLFGSCHSMHRIPTQQEVTQQEHHNIKLVFAHVHVAWQWVKWIRFAMSVWMFDTSKHNSNTSLVEWAADAGSKIITFGQECRLYVDGQVYRGIVTLDVQIKPNKIICVDSSTGSELYCIDTTHLRAINLSADSFQPGYQVLRISGLHVYNHNLPDRITDTPYDADAGETNATGDRYRVTLKCRSQHNWVTEHLPVSVNSPSAELRARSGDVVDVKWKTPVDFDIHETELALESTAGIDIMLFKTKAEHFSDSSGSGENGGGAGPNKHEELVCTQFVPFRTLIRNAHSTTRVCGAELSAVKVNLKSHTGLPLIARL
jgi:hypothetical protein